MFNGAHLLFYTVDPDADRAFVRDVLGLRSVDVGGGWLIFRLPLTEAAFHPAEAPFVQEHATHPLLGAVLYLMCDDVKATIAKLAEKRVTCSAIQEAEWGLATTIPLPSGASLGLYQPLHPTALDI
jgi:hypothetical protein